MLDIWRDCSQESIMIMFTIGKIKIKLPQHLQQQQRRRQRRLVNFYEQNFCHSIIFWNHNFYYYFTQGYSNDKMLFPLYYYEDVF